MTAETVKLTITINIEGPNNDEVPIAFQHAIDGMSLGSGGNGHTANGTRYDYKVESNQPPVPMTMERLLDWMHKNGDEDVRQQLNETFGYKR